jgi:hypothetical protein
MTPPSPSRTEVILDVENYRITRLFAGGIMSYKDLGRKSNR